MTRRARQTGRREKKIRDVFVGRPFEGLAGETDWVALRELVPAATAPVRLAGEQAERPVVLTTVLPMAFPALVKPDGRIFLALQSPARSGDLSRDLAAVLAHALRAEPGTYVTATDLPGPGPRLQDLLVVDEPLAVDLQETFGYWLDDEAPSDPEVAASLQRANGAILPTRRLAAAPSAYWCQVPEKAHVRWVLPDGEDAALDALARLQAGDGLGLGAGSRYVGAFRAHGLLVPVWDLPREEAPSAYEDGLAALVGRYRDALAAPGALTPAERRVREGLRGRQLTLR